MPAVLQEWLVDPHDFLAGHAPARIKKHVADARELQWKHARSWLVSGLQQGAAARLVSDFRLLPQKTVPAQLLDLAAGRARNAEAFVVFINALIQAPSDASPGAALEGLDHRLVELRIQHVVGVK